jgi:carbonic anhydrase/acetyltransferase-like protein (isoleucine patch superfamily)
VHVKHIPNAKTNTNVVSHRGSRRAHSLFDPRLRPIFDKSWSESSRDTLAFIANGAKSAITYHSEGRMIRPYKGIGPIIPDSCYIDESAQVIGDVVLGEQASVWMNAVVRGDVHSIRIGAYSNVQDCSVLHGMRDQYSVNIGEWVTVGHNVTLHGCTIEDTCLIGMGSVILNNARIGRGSIIAAGTVIPENAVIEPNSLVIGVPGKMRRKLKPEDEESILRYARNYLDYTQSYLQERRASAL